MARKKIDPYTTLFGFFNEIGIIDQLAQTALARELPEGLTPSQFGVLNHLSRRKSEESPAQLAKAFQVTKGAMTNTLGKLEAQKLVEIRPDPEDGRAKLVSISRKGAAVQKECVKATRPYLRALSKKIDVTPLIDLIPLLQEVRMILDEDRNPMDYPERYGS